MTVETGLVQYYNVQYTEGVACGYHKNLQFTQCDVLCLLSICSCSNSSSFLIFILEEPNVKLKTAIQCLKERRSTVIMYTVYIQYLLNRNNTSSRLQGGLRAITSLLIIIIIRLINS